ncbi:hypothetical protein A3A79_01320 [Candidatus Gottesmanbacteria bacterium RIFCSPLOWO2_01_FULL_43_11b]|uniref:Cohesin domain-containing protein n=1 Tax=Candidatus Gottesmanbacteria bacterium RIFCSPLOWO2_01_FULL_43_11b TaxID=1798392 RepID=A0A1F6AGE6_9BACT|nr:MAG: hypothetical protein A3A79_01320 [Candidatus Gottesmanbacteria bacterium RIFCSPLOWO2_01_FULL_43_11b]
MKKLSIIVLFISLLFLAVVALTVSLVQRRQEVRTRATAATTLSIIPSSVQAHIGDTFSVDVWINTGENTVSAATVVVTFNSNVLTGVSIQPGTFLSVPLEPGSFSAGVARISLGSQPTAPVQGSGALFTLTFQATGVGTTTITFDPTTVVAALGHTTSVLTGTTPGSITVSLVPTPTPTPTITPTPTPSPTPTPTATPTPTPLPPRPGDLDLDRDVDIYDYNLLVTDFGKTGTAGFIAADIDKNGKVDIFDYNILVEEFGK